MKINNGNVLMIAHRGASAIERENTNAAFIVAGNKSYYGIETDVHLTKDGKFILCHDDNISRITGVDLVIEESNFDDLIKNKILDFDLTYRSDLVLPTLEDYFKICVKYDKQAILEIKNNFPYDKIVEIIEKIKEFDWLERTTFISFDIENLINIRKYYEDADVQFLTEEATEETLNLLLRYRMDLDIYYKSLTKEYVDKLHEYNIKVNVWTVDIQLEAYELIEMGVDMLTSNTLE